VGESGARSRSTNLSRSALIVAIAIPFAMATIFVLMNFFKISANLLSLGAINFGIIVDTAFVVTDAMLRRREAKPDERITAGCHPRGRSGRAFATRIKRNGRRIAQDCVVFRRCRAGYDPRALCRQTDSPNVANSSSPGPCPTAVRMVAFLPRLSNPAAHFLQRRSCVWLLPRGSRAYPGAPWPFHLRHRARRGNVLFTYKKNCWDCWTI
jgi:hypothetical protein